MDNTAQDFARRILAQLEKIVHLLSISPPRQNDTHTNNEPQQSSENPPATKSGIASTPSPKKADIAKDADNRPAPWWRTWRLFEAIGVVAAVVVAGVNAFQWRDANRNFRADERPWLRIEFLANGTDAKADEPIHYYFPVNEVIRIPIRIRNTGKTPALNITAEVYIEMAGINEVMYFPVEPNGSAPLIRGHSPIGGGLNASSHIKTGVIFPDQTSGTVNITRSEVVNGNLTATPLTEPEARRLIGGDLVYAVARISYSDSFGNIHWTRFCKGLTEAANVNDRCIEYNAVDPNN